METIKGKVLPSVYKVKEKYFLSPHYIRVIFSTSEAQMGLLAHAQIGGNNKIFVPRGGVVEDQFVSGIIANQELVSIRRTYTNRHIDLRRKELWIDFVAHGDNGPASAWAQRAATGDLLGIAVKPGNKPLLPEADEYLLVGDSTALPVIGAMLALMPKDVRVKAIIEVFGEEDEIQLVCRASLELQWLHNPHPEKESSLASLVRETALPSGSRYAFVAAEAETTKKLKTFFKDEQGWLQNEFRAVSYWKKGESEDQSHAERAMQRGA
jgi:NADPH-dependent ferric siderophore reductase